MDRLSIILNELNEELASGKTLDEVLEYFDITEYFVVSKGDEFDGCVTLRGYENNPTVENSFVVSNGRLSYVSNQDTLNQYLSEMDTSEFY